MRWGVFELLNKSLVWRRGDLNRFGDTGDWIDVRWTGGQYISDGVVLRVKADLEWSLKQWVKGCWPEGSVIVKVETIMGRNAWAASAAWKEVGGGHSNRVEET